MRALALAVGLAAMLATSSSAAAAVSAGGTGWVWSNPLPQGGDLDAIAFSGARGIAVGADGLDPPHRGRRRQLVGGRLRDRDGSHRGGHARRQHRLRRRRLRAAAQHRRRARPSSASRSPCASRSAPASSPSSRSRRPSLGYLILTDGNVLRTTNGGRSFARRATPEHRQLGAPGRRGRCRLHQRDDRADQHRPQQPDVPAHRGRRADAGRAITPVDGTRRTEPSRGCAA